MDESTDVSRFDAATKGPALVLVHGGQHDSRCWQLTVAELRGREPEVDVLAVDLPGRDDDREELAAYSVETCVATVCAQIDAARLESVVLVGHSAAGLVLPAVAERLGAARVSRLVFLAACIPPEGGAIADALRGPLRPFARLAALRKSPQPPMPRLLARAVFCNGMSAQQRRFALARLCADASNLSTIRVSRAGLPIGIPRTWILTLRDRSLNPAQQRQSIDRLGGVEEVVELDCCHDAMIAEPEALAAILLDRVSTARPGPGPDDAGG